MDPEKLTITIPACTEQYDERTSTFIPATKPQTLMLKHSLVSMAKWEAKWHKPYLSQENKSIEELIDYVRCMTLTQNVDPNSYSALAYAPDVLLKVSKYINDSMTATTFPDRKKNSSSREVVTAEVIYHWMVYYGIPFECQKWHLSRLLTLIHVCNVKSEPQKKKSRREVLAENRALNAARRKKMNTKG